ncbi:MAG: hypothetical protein U9R75_03470 [Candidatus Thermoplasmatota archaeon]|nr:hypothetical protein [Candidatus Thermoplasmatota archaeon]
MKNLWPAMITAALFILVLMPKTTSAASAGMSLEDDEFYISVDPSDEENKGYLEIHGTVEGSIPNLRERVTVQLDVTIYEHREGEPTGNKWACGVSFDGSSVDSDTTVLTWNDDSADFTITISSELYDPQDEEVIAVPEGIGPNVTGALEITASYSGDASGSDTETATIEPEYYHLVRISTNTDPLEIIANKFITYTFRVINEGNEIESIALELPTFEELKTEGWTGTISQTHGDFMEPGSEFKAVMTLQAPKMISRNENLDFRVRAYTDFFDPDTGEPVSEYEIIIEFQLKESGAEEPITDDDIVDDDGEADDSPVVMIVVVIIVVVVVGLVLILFFIKGGGGDEGDEEEPDMHSSLVRI